MRTIVFTTFGHRPNFLSTFQLLLDEFEQLTGIHVVLRRMDWQSGRRDLVNIALDRAGADVSEIGTTWLSELAILNVVRPLDLVEQHQLGIPEEYFPIAVQSCKLTADQRIWAVPWLSETLAFYYRKDLFDQAGLIAGISKTDVYALLASAARLSEIGVAAPFALPGRADHLSMIQCVASWFWQTYPDLFLYDPQGFRVNVEPLVEITSALFNLLQFCTPEALRIIDQEGIYAAFHHGLSAASLAGMWMGRVTPGDTLPVVASEMKVTQLPTGAFTGGTNLIVWKHSAESRAAIELIRFLSSARVASMIAVGTDYIPSRWNLASKAVEFQTPVYQVFSEAMYRGRSFPNMPLWGAVEEKFARALSDIWSDYLTHPAADVKTTTSQAIRRFSEQVRAIMAQAV